MTRMVFDGLTARGAAPLKRISAASEAIAAAAAPIALVGRVFMAALFANEGIGKITDFAGTAAYMESFGVSPKLEPFAMIIEIFGALAILFGLATRVSAIILCLYTLLLAAFFHANFADLDQYIHFQKNFAIAGGFLAFAAFGPGAWSLDAWLTKRSARP
jgi:putative oxidoreductase